MGPNVKKWMRQGAEAAIGRFDPIREGHEVVTRRNFVTLGRHNGATLRTERVIDMTPCSVEIHDNHVKVRNFEQPSGYLGYTHQEVELSFTDVSQIDMMIKALQSCREAYVEASEKRAESMRRAFNY